MSSWNLRLKQANRTRKDTRVNLLPLSIWIRDTLALEYHLQLEVLYTGAGSLMSLQLLMRVAIASTMLNEMGYGPMVTHTAEEYEAAAQVVFSSGEEGCFRFNDETYWLFARLLTIHDEQLASTPVKAIDVVAQRLERSSH